MLDDAFAATLRVARAFGLLGVAYLVGGSLASSLHGIPRSTNDADLVAVLQLRHVDGFVRELEGGFYIDADMIRDAIRRCASFYSSICKPCSRSMCSS